MDNKKVVILAGATISGVALGFLLGSRFCKTDLWNEFRIYFKGLSGNEKRQLSEYISKNSYREPEVLTKLSLGTKQGYIRDKAMATTSSQNQFFRLLLKTINAKKAIEIGVFTGLNLLSTALALPDDGKVVGLDTNEEYVSYGKPYFKEANVEHKIDLRIQPALTSLDEMLAAGEAGTYDFVLIDADKTNYDAYYERSLKLVRAGGIIAVDNVLWNGRVCAPVSSMSEATAAIHALNKKIHKDSRVDMCMLTISDGVTLVRKH